MPNILTINAGSSSIRFALFDMRRDGRSVCWTEKWSASGARMFA